MSKRKIEYSQIVRRKLNVLRRDLAGEYGKDFSKETMKKITLVINSLGEFPERGTNISKMYAIDTEYSYIFVAHNYFVYRIEEQKVIVVQMFHEHENFMMKLFGISGRTQDSIDFWGE